MKKVNYLFSYVDNICFLMEYGIAILHYYFVILNHVDIIIIHFIGCFFTKKMC